MERISVESSNIESIGWDNGTLEIEFKGNRVYQYMGVPKEIYTSMMLSDSVGKFFNANIRGTYNHISL